MDRLPNRDAFSRINFQPVRNSRILKCDSSPPGERGLAPRLDTWLTTYAGAEDTPLNRAVGRLMLIAAVRRIRTPGVKFDEMVVLILHREDIFQLTIVALGPAVCTCASINELACNADPIADSPYAAFENVADAKLAPDLSNIW